MTRSTEERILVAQSEEFTKLSLGMLGCSDLSSMPSITHRPACPLAPTLIRDYRHITDEEKQGLTKAYYSRDGVAYFIVLNPPEERQRPHPLHEINSQLVEELNLRHPLIHPLEGHPEAIARYGEADGTVKIYDLPGKGGAAGYREQAETSDLFAMHHDGLGSGGTVETTVLYCDVPPLWGGYTFFQNMLHLGLELARVDPAAFESLFLPDAITIVRPRGKGAIKVRTPVMFMNEDHKPQSFCRMPSGEYQVTWREDDLPLKRARLFLERHCGPFAYGSTFLHLSGRGHGCLVRNQVVAHGRTAFSNRPGAEIGRTLSRKWFMRSAGHAIYKHVPGMFLLQESKVCFPEYCGADVLEGEWLYDALADTNKRVK